MSDPAAPESETIELQDDPPVALLVCSLLSIAPLFVYGEAAIWFSGAMLLVFGSLSAWFTFARRRMRVTLNRAAGTLAVESGPKQRVLALGEVAGARVAAAGPKARRVELVLRSGEVLPLYIGLGGFRAKDCERLAGRINALLTQ